MLKRCQKQEKIGSFQLFMPKRIKARWAKHHNLPPRTYYQYAILPSLQRANVSEKEFKKSWAYVHPRLTNDELFSLFKDSGFSPDEITGRLAFVLAVLQRYKDAKVFFF